jgi:hypothetical protein
MLHAFESLSAVDKNSAEAYMKLLLSLVFSYDFDYDAPYRRKLTTWRKDAEPFIKRFKLPRKDLDFSYRELLKENDPNDDEKLHYAITRLTESLKDYKKSFSKELDLSKEDLAFLNDIRLFQTTESESAHKRLTRLVSRFADPDINSMFVQEHSDTSPEQDELMSLVKKHGVKAGMVMPVGVLKSWQEKSKRTGNKVADHTRYLQLKRSLNDSYKNRLQSIVRSSGKPMVSLRSVIETLDNEAIPHSLPSGFVGLIDDNGKFYTTKGNRLLQAPSGDVRMNTQYDAAQDNAYVCEFTPPFAAAPTRAYTESFRSMKKKAKFSVVLETIPKLPGFARKWRGDMKRPQTRDGILATMVEFIYTTSARVSNKDAFSKGSKTFGVTTLQVQHVKMDDHKIIARYTGKSGGKQHHIIKLGSSQPLKRLHKNMQLFMKGKRSEDTIFEFKDKLLTGTAITNYMRGLGMPPKFTIHKLRTARGTELARKLLKESVFKKGDGVTEREINDWVEKQLLKVGVELGHMSGENFTSTTAVQNYILPEILEEFYSKLGMRPPARIQKAIDSIKS